MSASRASGWAGLDMRTWRSLLLSETARMRTSTSSALGVGVAASVFSSSESKVLLEPVTRYSRWMLGSLLAVMVAVEVYGRGARRRRARGGIVPHLATSDFFISELHSCQLADSPFYSLKADRTASSLVTERARPHRGRRPRPPCPASSARRTDYLECARALA